MVRLKSNMLSLFFGLGVIAITVVSAMSQSALSSLESQAGFEYLKTLEGHWVVLGDKESPFGWEFEVTSRGSVIVERLKVGTPTEMATMYFLDDGKLNASHYCQLMNQPHLLAMNSEVEGDIHFLCNGDVGNTDSHDELHMHGVHFQKQGDSLLIWMDMFKSGKIAFQTSYELVRHDSKDNSVETNKAYNDGLLD